MSEAATPKKSSGKLKSLGKIMMTLLVFISGVAAGGGGAVIALTQLGGLGGVAKLVPSPAHEAPAELVKAKLAYVEIDNAFTSNLIDTGRYLQLHIAVSTSGGPEVTAAITEHKPAIVSAVLAVLGEAGENDVGDREAKNRLRASLRTAINDILKSKAGTTGVDEVFFTSLVVQ